VAFNRSFADAGLDWQWSVALYGELLEISGGKERIRAYINKCQPDFTPPINLDDYIAQLHHNKNHHYQELLSTGAVPLRPGVKRLLAEASSQQVRLAIATTSALPNTLALLEKYLDPAWFEVIAAGDIVSAKKPAPDIYHYVLEKMGLAAEECLVFEDSPQGLQASIGAGLHTVVTVHDYTKQYNFSDAVLVLNHLGEPDKPFQVLVGDAFAAKYFGLELARSLLK
jgi:HAD superfamily hydrolase (TIGR01509 family)